MRLHHALLALLLLGSGCFGGDYTADGGDDAIFGVLPDLGGPICSGNNDGVIDRSELTFPLGVTVNYLVNPVGTTVSVNPDGVLGVSGPEWDLTNTEGVVQPLTIEPITETWYAAKFPTATYATLSDIASGTLGVFRVDDDGLYLLGFVSPEPNKTLLIYEQPIATVHFPIKLGDAWVTGSKITFGTLEGMPFASSDTYKISVDARGIADLPYLTFDNTLRIHVELSQALPGGQNVTHIQHLFFHECFGELGRMVSNTGETNPSFTTASEFRRLAL